MENMCCTRPVSEEQTLFHALSRKKTTVVSEKEIGHHRKNIEGYLQPSQTLVYTDQQRLQDFKVVFFPSPT